MTNKYRSGSTAAPDPLLMTAKDVATSLAIGVRTLWRCVSGHTFPAPDFTIGAKIVRWKRSTVLAWLDCKEEDSGMRTTEWKCSMNKVTKVKKQQFETGCDEMKQWKGGAFPDEASRFLKYSIKGFRER